MLPFCFSYAVLRADLDFLAVRPPGVCRIRISSRILEHLHGTYFVDFSRIFDATVDLTGFRRRRQYLQIFRIGKKK